MDLQKLQIKTSIWDVIDYVNELFDEAIEENISDIHIEPTSNFILVRFRQDWEFILRDKIDVENTSALVTRIKVLAQLKIDENKKPQDWKISYNSERLKEKSIFVSLLFLQTIEKK